MIICELVYSSDKGDDDRRTGGRGSHAKDCKQVIFHPSSQTKSVDDSNLIGGVLDGHFRVLPMADFLCLPLTAKHLSPFRREQKTPAQMAFC